MKDPIKLTLLSNNPDFPCAYTMTIGNDEDLCDEHRLAYINGMCNQKLLQFAVEQGTSCPVCLSEIVRDLFLLSMAGTARAKEEGDLEAYRDNEHTCGEMALVHIGLRNLIMGDLQEFGDISLDVDIDELFFEEDDHSGACLEDDE